MNFEGPAKKLSGIPAESVSSNKIDRRKRLVAAATVGVLAAVDAYAQGDAQEYPAEPSVAIKYEGIPKPVVADEQGRASLPVAVRQKHEEFSVPSDDDGVETEGGSGSTEKPGRTVLFSEYQAGKVPSADPEVVNEIYAERIGELKRLPHADFRTEGERKIDALVSKTERELGTREVVVWTGEQIRKLLNRMAELTGVDPNGSVQKAGDLLVSGVVALADAVLADKIRALAIRSLVAENTNQSNRIGGSAVFQGEAVNTTLHFDASHMNARNMLFQHTLGSKSGGWELTFGADPGPGISDMVKGKKLTPAIGVMFRYKLP